MFAVARQYCFGALAPLCRIMVLMQITKQPKADRSPNANELVRRALLAEMGVHCWLPRKPLPGAADSHQDIFASESVNAVDDVTPDTGVQPDKVQTAPAGRAAGIDAALKSLNADATGSTHTPQIQADVSADAETGIGAAAPDIAEVRFAFSWFTLDRRLAVMAMLPEGDARLSANRRDMLQKIVAALDPGYRAVEVTEHSFHWPFADDLGLPSDADAAQQTVAGFIARRMREQSVASLLVLADEEPFFLFADGTPQDGIVIHAQYGFGVLRTHSLHAMEQQPALKRSAWQAMQRLLPRIKPASE